MKINIGDEITATYSCSGRRSILFLKVTKIGRKYIHGITQFVDIDGQTRNGHEAKVNIEERTIYKGFRHELLAKERQYRKEYQGWQYRHQEKEKEINWELRDLIRKRMDTWKLENPMPERHELPTK